MVSRRQFLGKSAVVAASALAARNSDALSRPASGLGLHTCKVSLNGVWQFQLDPNDAGKRENWAAPDYSAASWREVSVPHTWQVEAANADYRGVAWYRREFDVVPEWTDGAVRLEFEAVFHSATVWVNGQPVGEHVGKGYTAFCLDATPALHPGKRNVVVVRVDNAFNEHMLPRGRSSDWAHDGGIFRPVNLLVTPKIFIERLAIEAVPDLSSGSATVMVSAHCRNTGGESWSGAASCRIVDEETGLLAGGADSTATLTMRPGTDGSVTLRQTISAAKLWHFDAPCLYRAVVEIANGRESHEYAATFGVRKFEIAAGKFHLNGEPVRLMGVERMAGSHPELGMAETGAWIEHDHHDMKDLNCVFSRVHWPQDERVLDYCDRHGILMQLEIPAWGPDTFSGMGAQADSGILQNGLEQLREMIQRDRNHPSVVAWGLCNEIDGQNPAAYHFAQRMLEEAKRLDPSRLCSYASHSLRETPERDVAGLMDFIETNEYFGSWQAGGADELDEHLDTLHRAFPNKPVVISEYGYCACTADRPEGDERRIEVLRTHDQVLRSKDFVGGAIFFCYNDYRTHVGDRGVGVMQQRVHGVVDVYGARKPSYRVLAHESSPVESVTVTNHLNDFHLVIKSRGTVPSYTLRDYTLLGVFYGQGDIPVELCELKLPVLAPGKTAEVDLSFTQTAPPRRVSFQIGRPTGSLAISFEWTP